VSSDIWYSSLCGSELEGEEADTERRAFRSWGLNSFFRVREQVRSKPRYLPYFFSIGAKASGAYWTTTKRFPVNRHKGVAVFSRLLWRYCNSNFFTANCRPEESYSEITRTWLFCWLYGNARNPDCCTRRAAKSPVDNWLTQNSGR